MIAQVDEDIMEMMQTNEGNNVKELSMKQPVLLVFLRHFGCVFCKESIMDISEMANKFDHNKVQLVFVHMAEEDVAAQYFEDYKLSEIPRVSDPEMGYYTRFGLVKAGFSQLYGLSTWMRGFTLQRQGIKSELSKRLGDATQMPGIFKIDKGVIVDSYIHKKASDRPDYKRFIDETK